MVHEAVDRSERHGGIGKDAVPFAERLVGRDEGGASLVASADQLKQHARFGLVLGDVCQVVEDEQVIFVELGDRAFESQLTPSDL